MPAIRCEPTALATQTRFADIADIAIFAGLVRLATAALALAIDWTTPLVFGRKDILGRFKFA